MKKLLSSLVLLLVASLSQITLGQTTTVTTSRMHPIFYAGLLNQPVMRVNVKASTSGQKVLKFTFTSGATTKPSSYVKAAKLYSSSSTPFFSLHSAVDARKAKSVGDVVFNKTKTEMTVTLDKSLSEGNNYFWLTYDVSALAKGESKMDAVCTGVTVSNGSSSATSNATTSGQVDYVDIGLNGSDNTVVLSSEDKGVAGQVYWFKNRIVPYLRASHVSPTGWSKNLMSEKHFTVITDAIIFSIGANADGSAPLSGPVAEAFDRMRELRGKNTKVKLVVGIAGAAANLAKIAASDTLRVQYVNNVIARMDEVGAEGLDVDWEYIDSSNTTGFYQYALLLNTFRERFAGTGRSISIAVNPQWNMVTQEVCDQVDYVNSMTYDRTGYHSTFQHVVDDLGVLRRYNIPDAKIVMGLPFYSMNYEGAQNWNTQTGYSSIISQYPNISPKENTFYNKNSKENHYFNGANLIKQKCSYCKKQKIGGVMIWAYDTDLPLTDRRSLGKALSTVLKQTKR